MINASVAIQILPNVLDDEHLCKIVDEVIYYIICYNPTNEILTIDKKITKHQDKERK